MFESLPLGLWVAWVLAVLWICVAVGLWATGARVANAGLASADRKSAVARFRLLHLLSLLLLLGLAAWMVIAVGFWQWWPIQPGTASVIFALTFVSGVGVLAIATTRYRLLPGRRWLRMAENSGILLMCLGLAFYAVVGMRSAEDLRTAWSYASGASLALALGFFLLSRAPARAALLLARQLASHGSQPRFEGTLKRLLRRHRPILMASAVAIVLGIAFSWKAAKADVGGGQVADASPTHQASSV